MHQLQALDLGAGRGISSYALAREGWQVTALEPDPSMLIGAGAIRSLVAKKAMVAVGMICQSSQRLFGTKPERWVTQRVRSGIGGVVGEAQDPMMQRKIPLHRTAS